MKIEILCTGDEILTGKTVNTNYSYMAQRLTDNALKMHWGTTVGDDRESLTEAFLQASQRADAVIVNGGLGPTVDDLSQEVAASTAGVELELHEEWLQRLKGFYASRNREMPPNNIKQAMLPVGCEFIDNPVGTACGFALTINRARFFFTPGVPHEMRKMLDEQVLPRLLKMSGLQVVTTLKRFHTFGVGESRADEFLKGIEDLAPDGSVKLGFQSHYPQLETKLAAQAADVETLNKVLAPVEQAVRQRFGNFILCEDDQTLEQVILDALHEKGGSLSTLEMTTGGAISMRLTSAVHANTERSDNPHNCSIVSQDLPQLARAVGLQSIELNAEGASQLANALRTHSGSSHALVSLINPDQAKDSRSYGADLITAISSTDGCSVREARLTGGKKWVMLGATELNLDCLRRYLTGLPIDEKIDFEQQ